MQYMNINGTNETKCAEQVKQGVWYNWWKVIHDTQSTQISKKQDGCHILHIYNHENNAHRCITCHKVDEHKGLQYN